MRYVMPFLLAMIVSMALQPVLGRFASKWGIVDPPGTRKVHDTPIPRIGGLAMVIGVLVAALLTIDLAPGDRYFLIAAGVLMIFGVLDDRFDLDYRVKLAGQLLAVLIVVFLGDIQIRSITLDDRVMLPSWISLPLTIFFLVGITNAINLADGLDGLAGGTTFLCFGALAMLAHISGETVCASLTFAFAGAVLGFLRFNTYPATVFMGDAGSQLLGFAVGVLSLRATQSSETVISAATPLLLFALPILDTLSVMVQRIGEGRSPFSADKNHIHHKLLKLGFDHHEAVLVIYLIQGALFLLAYGLRFESDLTILGVVLAFFAISIGMIQLALRRGWRLRSANGKSKQSPVTRFVGRLREPQRLPRWSYLAVTTAVGVYAALILVQTASLKGDLQILAAGLLTVAVSLLALLRLKPLSLIEKATLYITMTMLVYLDTVVVPVQHLFSVLEWSAVAVAAVGTAVRLRLDPDRRFELTPLDLIVLFAALVVPSLPGTFALPNGGAAGIAKLAILFYALEVLTSLAELGVVWLRIAVATFLAGLMLRPLLPI
jgi:UDP-GlcNAc:undecaprenyl-phosphate/decaprenyl-phosphate GlcNAc-1-phosphate transferase